MAETTHSIKLLKIGEGLYTFDATKLGGLASSEYALNKDIAGVVGAMVYQGTLLSSAATIGYTPAARKGHVYVVAVAGTVNGIKCESGDMWICNEAVDACTASTTTAVNAKWNVVQANIDAAAFAKSNHKHSVTNAGTVNDREITPKGTVSKPTFTGTKSSHKHTVSSHSEHTFTGTGVELVGTFTGESASISGNYTPAGTNTKATVTPTGNVTVSTTAAAAGTTPDFYSATGTTNGSGKHKHTGSVSIDYAPAGTVGITNASTGTINYTPSGNLSEDGAHTHDVNVSIDYTPAGSVTGGAHTHTVSANGKFTPAGTVAVVTSGGTEHEHTITPTTAKAITSISGMLTGELDGDTLVLSHTLQPELSDFMIGATVNATMLKFNGTQGDVSVSGSAASAAPANLTFTGTAATLTQATQAESAGAHKHTFTGTGARLTAAFTGTSTKLSGNFETNEVADHTHAFTGTGKMFAATFTGTASEHTHTFNGSSKAIGGTVTAKGSVAISVGKGVANYTPSGTISTTAIDLETDIVEITPTGSVSQPTFTGTPESHNHSFTGSTVDSSVEK